MTKSRPDNSEALRSASSRRSQLAREKTLDAIATLTAEGQAVTPTTVARRAGVSRQWLYTFEEALAAIHIARRTAPAKTVPQDEQASVASLHRRIETLTDANRRLRDRVGELEQRLAGAYGALRSSRP